MTHLRLLTAALGIACCVAVGSCKTTPPGSPVKDPTWQVFTTENSPLLADKINCILIDGEGRVWIGTDSGVSSYAPGSWGTIKDQLTYLTDAGPARIVTAIAEGAGHTLWFGLNGGGVRRYNRFSPRHVWQEYQYPSIPYDVVWSIAAMKYQPYQVWVGTVFGTGRYTPSASDPEIGIWDSVAIPTLPYGLVHSISVDPTNSWIGFGTQFGPAFFNFTEGWRTYSLPPAYDYPILSVSFDLHLNVWMGKLDGVTCFGLGTWNIHHYTSENTGGQLPRGTVHAVTTDLFSTRWFGTDAGLVRLRDTTWTRFSRSNSPLPSDTVTALGYDKAGKLWIGTTRGVAVYDENGASF